ncbi:MAG: phage holin family protein [Acidimicrobiales bacterium]|jgi:F0F1-type ATP synthase assembly protein I|nr:phage holin family protein [Acidimicrobiales bacterium]
MAIDQPPDAALPTEPKAPEKSLGQLFSELTSDLSTLMRKEVELAKVETKQEVSRAGKAGGMLGGGAFAGYFALLFLSFALAWLLDEWMHTALAFLIVGLLYGVVAAVLVVRGRARLQSVNPVPTQTVETLKEDVQWAKAQRS